MTSRERVLTALDHREPDRVPIDFGGTRLSGIAASAYYRLKQHLGLGGPARVFDLFQMLAEVERPVMERFGADVIGIYRPSAVFGIRNERWKPWQRRNPGGSAGRFSSRGAAGRQLGDLLSGRQTVGFDAQRRLLFRPAGKISRSDAPGSGNAGTSLLTQEECDFLAAQAEAYYHNTEFAIIVQMGPPYELFFGLGTGDFAAWMMTLATEPDYVEALYERLVEAWLENLRRLYAAVKLRPDRAFQRRFGHPSGPFLSVSMFRRLIMLFYKRGLD